MFAQLALLSSLFFSLQFALLLPVFFVFFSEIKQSFLEAQLPLVVFEDLALFVLANIFLLGLVLGGVWAMAKIVAHHRQLTERQTKRIGLLLWSVAIVSILSANQYFFPRTLLAEGTSYVFYDGFNPYLLLMCVSLLVGTALYCLLGGLRSLLKSNHKYYWLTLIISMGSLCTLIVKQPYAHSFATDGTKPNIILLGIDSLRLDHVGFYNAGSKLTPHLDEFLKSSTSFTRAYTPLARTFPAWISILSGQYPRESAARFNLKQPDTLNIRDTLPELLKKAGYQTVYATDSKRFVNLSKHYGFNQELGPKIGLNSFLLGGMNLFPLTNLVSNTVLGKWLLPYHYSNRDNDKIYYPHTFTKTIRSIRQSPEQPLFLAMHLCLAHWPYISANSTSFASSKHTLPDSQDLGTYQESIRAVDQQFQALITQMRKQRLLDNAILVVISDHGEALNLAGDRLLESDRYQPQHDAKQSVSHLSQYLFNNQLNKSSGHGTDILSASQYKILMAFKLFGDKTNAAKKLNFLTSLLDIKPTLLELIHMEDEQHSGRSLANHLFGSPPPPKKQPFFLETGFSPRKLNLLKPDVKQAIKISTKFYQVNPSGHIELKTEAEPMMLAEKQRGVIYEDWQLSLYPKNDRFVTILTHLGTQEWSDNLQSSFAKNSPAKTMLQWLKNFYGEELADKI